MCGGHDFQPRWQHGTAYHAYIARRKGFGGGRAEGPGLGSPGVTILHISDTEFGNFHRFGEREHDSLAGRLDQALGNLFDERPAIDLVVISGDVTHSGLPAQFEQARAFINHLCPNLSVGPPSDAVTPPDTSRVIVVPGNHDVNRVLCRNYFSQQDVYDKKPEPPYAQKWAPYEAFVTGLHGPEAFTADRPYRLHVYKRLGLNGLPVVVAALNSTMAETHEQHYGFCGEDQFRWFVGELERYPDFLRIGVVHHNARRQAEDPEENLRDEEDLTQILGPHLDLVLHGHTHRSGRDRLGKGVDTLVLATGSAAVASPQRPPDVPNQCQILKIEPGQLTRWGLRYQPEEKRWVTDSSVSKDGRSWVAGMNFEVPGWQVSWEAAEVLRGETDEAWQRDVPIVVRSTARTDVIRRAFRSVRTGHSSYWETFHGTDVWFPADLTPDGGEPGAEFIRDVVEVTSLRDDVKSIRVETTDWCYYLRVFYEPRGMYAVGSEKMKAVGLVDGSLGQEHVDRFCEQVHGPIRSRNPEALSELVHTGSLDAGLKKQARQRGVAVKTWTEYQSLLDLSAYRTKQQWVLENNGLYPLDLYVNQRYHVVDSRGRSQDETRDKLDQRVLEDILAEGSRFVLVLGDPGFGKSFLTRRVAYELLAGDSRESGVTPLLLELRGEKGRSFRDLVTQALDRGDASAARQFDKFTSMFGRGRVVVLADGYDEFAVRVGYDRAAEQLRTFLRALEGRAEAKVVLTTRPSHFRQHRQVVSKLFEDVIDIGADKARVYELLDFDQEQQQRFLTAWFALRGIPQPEAEQQAEEWIRALKAVNDLPELARTPRMLSFMAQDLDLDQIRDAATEEGPVTAARLYEMLIDIWLETETTKFEDDQARSSGLQRLTADRRFQPRGSGGSGRTVAADATTRDRLRRPGRLSLRDRWRVAEELAYRLWAANESSISETLLATVAGDGLDLPSVGMNLADAAQEIGSRTLLVGEGDERYFAHQSIYEFLLARKLAEKLESSENPPELGEAELSELTARFLRDLAPETGERWLRAIAADQG